MPGNGRATNMNKVYVGRNPFTGDDNVRVVCVWAGTANYCAYNQRGVWSGWRRQ
jgi:hypothetical protein